MVPEIGHRSITKELLMQSRKGRISINLPEKNGNTHIEESIQHVVGGIEGMKEESEVIERGREQRGQAIGNIAKWGQGREVRLDA